MLKDKTKRLGSRRCEDLKVLSKIMKILSCLEESSRRHLLVDIVQLMEDYMRDKWKQQETRSNQ